MNVSQLINEILSEWAYRVEDGMPNPKNPIHLKELGFVLSEMGLSHIENNLVKNLLGEAEEGGFKNPALNKKISYKNTKGEDAEGIVGNLLRLPAEHPGRKAAERTLPPEGSEERDALNKDLGGEGQPTKPEEPKTDKGGEEGGAPKEDPIQKAAAMFDPKADPAMGARLAKEKEIQAQLVGNGNEESPKEQPKEKEDGFNPIPSVDVQKEIPQADPETFGGESDIPDGIDEKDLEKFNTDISKVQQIVADAKAKGEKVPNINLCQITVPGTNLYCDDNLGIPRAEMPQFKGKAIEGSRAANMPVDKDGEVDTEPVFKEMLKQKGITVSQTEVPADKLKATQSELVGPKVVGMMGALEENPQHEKITAPIYVSRDGYVIDGHHRWAAIAAYNAKHPDAQIPMKVQVIDQDIKDAIPMCNQFAEDIGIAAKKADANKETPSDVKVKEEPKAEELKPNEKDPESKVKTFKGESSGKEIKTVELEGGGMVFGTVHRDTKMADDIINQVKATIPKDKWKDIVFVGEGGATGDSGELEFNDEMEYSAPKFKEMGAEIDTWDGDELDVHNDQSDLYKSQIEQTGLSHSKVKAGNWASMIGQGEGTDTMSPNDYLDDEGKEFLQQSAKEAGFPEIENWDEPTEQDKDILYRLSFPEDNGDKETGVNNVQVAFNKARDLNLIKKQKELASKGKIPIVMAGESHTELVDDILRGKKQETYQMKEDLFPMIDSLIEGIIIDFINEANPIKAADDVMNTMVKYKDEKGKDHEVKVATALKYKNSTNRGQLQAYNQALKLLKKAGVGDKELGKPKQIKGAGLGYRQTGEKELEPKKSKDSTLAKNPNKAMDDIAKAKSKIQSAAVAKGKMSQKDLDSAIAVATKIINGTKLNAKDREIADKYIRIKNNPTDSSIYLLFPPFNSQNHAKIGIGNYDKLVAYGKENGVRGTAEVGASGSDPNADKQKIPKKGVAGANINKNTVDTEIKSDKKGFSFGKTGARVEKVKEYSKNEQTALVQKLIKRGMDKQEAEELVSRFALESERRNKVVDFFKKSDNVKTLDWGAEPTTDAGRATILKNVREKSIAQFEKLFKKASGGTLTKDEKKVLDFYKSIKTPYETPNFDKLSEPLKQKLRDKYESEMHTLMEMMVKTPSFRQGVPDFAEVIRYSIYIGKGYEAYLPADSTFQISDIIVFAPLDKLGDKDLVDRLSETPSLLIETMVFTGGVSEKFMDGGAPSGEERLRQSEFRNGDGSFKTQERLLNNMKVYNFTFRHKDKFIENNPRNREDWKKLSLEQQAKLLRKWEDEMNQMPDDKEIEAFQKQLDNTMNDALKAGILSPDEIEKIKEQGKRQGELLVNKANAKGAGNCLDKKNLQRYHNMLRLWTLMGAITEKINNNDLKYTLFKNSREEFDTKGNFKKNEIIDGVKVKPGMKWKYDPGIDATSSVPSIEKHKAVKNGPRGCKFLAMNNPNSASIVPVK